MPFPWTKNRVTRFSQIVADLQFQSPKRGRSLVVQTGFPTSLIDLLIKNRNRFKKPRFNKPLRTEIPDSPPPPPPPSPVTTPPSITEPLIPYVSPPESPMPSPVTEEITDGAPVLERVDGRRFVPSRKLVIVKLLTVMILLAIVKGFTVAFTVSAFSLLFLEYAVKRVVSFIKPCSEAIFTMESQFQKVLFQLKTKQSHEPTIVQSGGVQIELNLNLNSSTVDEIEAVESKNELEPLNSEYKIKSRSGRFKAKIVKKLISKKFRCSKKEKTMMEEDKGKESKENVGDLISEISSEEIKNEIECVSERDYEVDFGTTCSDESKSKAKAIGNSGYRILVIIVLVGLIVGRLPALLLTIVWCFLLKIVKTVWKSHIKASVPNS